MSSGFLNVEYISDPDYLVTPTNAQGWKEKALAEEYFATNFSDFDVSRSTRYGMYGYVMVTAKDGKSVLEPQTWSEVRQLHDKIMEISIEKDGKVFTYEEICTKFAGKCYTNSYLKYADTFEVLSKGYPLNRSIENYYQNYSGKIGPSIASDILALSINTSKSVNEYVEEITLLTNKTLVDLKTNLDVVSKAIIDFQTLTSDIFNKYKTQVEPTFEGIPLPAYFGGITLINKTLDNFDPCEIISFLRGNSTNQSTNQTCLHPQQLFSAMKDFYHHTEGGVISTRHVLQKINQDVKTALNFNLRTSTQTMIGLLSNISLSLEEFGLKVNTMVEGTKTLNAGSLLQAEAVLIGGLLNSDDYSEIAVEWEKEFTKLIHSSNFTTINVIPYVSNSLELEMVDSVSRLKPILSANIFLMILFCMAVCFTKDITTSKPWIGFAGLVSTLFGTASAFGLLVFLGAEFTNFNYCAVFILVGIGKKIPLLNFLA